MIDFLIKNIFLIICAIALVGFALTILWRFLNSPREEQIAKVKEWLVQACIEAEKEMRSGTGQLKLRHVWNKFLLVPSFSWVARIITFDQFESLVSIALTQSKEMLISNKTLAEYTYGFNWKEETEKLKEQLNRE